MSKIKIAIDSPGDLSLEIAEKNDISIIPIKFSLEDAEDLIRDKIDMTDCGFLDILHPYKTRGFSCDSKIKAFNLK